jgi:hypothetical protein
MVNGFIWLRIGSIGGFLCGWFDLSAYTPDTDAPTNRPTLAYILSLFSLKKVVYWKCFHIYYHDDYAY